MSPCRSLIPLAVFFAVMAVKSAEAAPQATFSRPSAARAERSVFQSLAAALPNPSKTALSAQAADDYTGILIDARSLPGILRSPAPSIYGPAPDTALLYPDRSHVPTPDDVQDESIVRYYHSEAEAEAGVAGSHPLILPAIAVLGYAKDALQLNVADMARLQDLDKKLHFTQTWKVGFLVPQGQ